MAQIELRTSARVQRETGMCEVLVRFFRGTRFNVRAKSGIYVSPDFFEYYIDRDKTEKAGISVPCHVTTATLKEAKRRHYVLRHSGTVVIRHRKEAPGVAYHRKQAARLKELTLFILEAYERDGVQRMSSAWLQHTVDSCRHPERQMMKAEKRPSFYELVDVYIAKRQLAPSHARVLKVLSRAVARYEGFVRATVPGMEEYAFDIDSVTRDDIEQLTSYLRHEKQLSAQHPQLFRELVTHYPAAAGKGYDNVAERGENTVVKMRTRLKSLFLFFYDEGMTKNRPFDGVRIGTAKVGTPYYINIEERNRIAEADLEAAWAALDDEGRKRCKVALKTLLTCRDIFVFQCLVGCRVSDLLRLTPGHVFNGMLVYTPHKTKDEGEEAVQARVPLHPMAEELIRKYQNVDRKGRLFPFVTAQVYNEAIKAVFTLAGITRNVEIRNPLTGENELRPISELASSHLARRTFVGNAYFKVSDPNLIGKMSGHVDGSRAFKRYRKIEDETLKHVIDLMG